MGIPVLSIVARSSGTGKTTVLEKLVTRLTQRGYRVGAVKHASLNIQIDKPGKDSWRFAEAGAKAVALVTEEKYVLIHKTAKRPSLQDIIKQIQDVDIILVEGFKQERLPKLEIVRAEKGCTIISFPEDLVAVVTDIEDLAVTVPAFTFEDVEGQVDFIEDKFLSPPQDRNGLTHFDANGRANMVDVSAKDATEREARACGEIAMKPSTLLLVKEGRMKKGDVLAVAQVAAIMGVKETSRLIPMCHPLLISGVSVDFSLDEINSKIEVTVSVKITGHTGVEMEALTGVNIALLTIYDMCKAVDKEMLIENIRLLEKKGGKSGHYRREDENRWGK